MKKPHKNTGIFSRHLFLLFHLPAHNAGSGFSHFYFGIAHSGILFPGKQHHSANGFPIRNNRQNATRLPPSIITECTVRR